MILELVGPPGSGKTYLSNKMVDVLNKQKIKCVNIIDIQRNNILVKIIWKLTRYIVKYNYNYKKDLLYFRQIFVDYNDIKSNFIKVDIDEYIQRLAFLRFLYRKLNNSSKIYIFDEGILQALLSMGIYFDIKEEIYERYLIDILPQDIMVINICATNKIVIESIRERNRHVCQMDEFNDDELNSFLNKYNEYYKNTIKQINCLNIDRSDQLERNIDIVIKSLKAHIKN